MCPTERTDHDRNPQALARRPRRHRPAVQRRPQRRLRRLRASTSACWPTNGCDGVAPNGSLGEYQTLSDGGARPGHHDGGRSGPRRLHRHGRRGRLRRTADPAMGGAGRRGRAPARHAAAARTPTGPTSDEVVDHYREVPRRRTADRGLQQPHRHQGRPDPAADRPAARRRPDRRRQGVHRRRPPGLRDQGARPEVDLLIGTDDTVARNGPRRRRRLGGRLPERHSAKPPRALPARHLRRRRGPGARPRNLPRPALAAALGHQDRVRPGHQAVHGRRRPPRRRLPPAARSAHRRGARRRHPDTEAALAKGYK